MVYTIGEMAHCGMQMNLREQGLSYCNTCHQILPLDKFYTTKKYNGSLKVEAHCRVCASKNRRERNKLKKVARWKNQLRN